MLHRWSTGTASPIESPERGGPDPHASRPQRHRPGQAEDVQVSGTVHLDHPLAEPVVPVTLEASSRPAVQPSPEGAPGAAARPPEIAACEHEPPGTRKEPPAPSSPPAGWFFARTLAPAPDPDRAPSRPDRVVGATKGQHWHSAAISRCCRPRGSKRDGRPAVRPASSAARFQPSMPVLVCAAPTGLLSGEPRCRR